MGEASNPGAECSVPNKGSGLRAIDDELLAPIQPVPDEVVHVLEFVRELAGRIGPIPEGGEVPAIVRRQRWSPINVPLMWAAAGGEPSTPVVVVGAVFFRCCTGAFP